MVGPSFPEDAAIIAIALLLPLTSPHDGLDVLLDVLLELLLGEDLPNGFMFVVTTMIPRLFKLPDLLLEVG